MSRGLGDLQCRIKAVMNLAATVGMPFMRYGDLRMAFAGHAQERSLRRALKGLIDRGDVLILGGKGGPGDPYRYTTVEAFAGITEPSRMPLKDTVEAKRKVAELSAVAQEAIGRLQSSNERLK
jgi:hypothetical protein